MTPSKSPAAPQVLALIATDQPVTLHCGGTHCAANLPTICIQPERRTPNVGRAYRLIHGQSITVVGDRGTKAVFADVRLVAKRSHVAVAVSISRALIGDLKNPRLLVGRGISAVPVPDATDLRPIHEKELAHAMGPRRAIATQMVDLEPARIPAVSMTNRLANLVQAGANRRQSWAKILADAKARNVSTAAIKYAHTMHDVCMYKLDAGITENLPMCIGELNDEAMYYLNVGLEAVLKSDI